MSWISENKIPAAIIGVSAVGALALGALLFNTYSSYSESLERFDALNNGVAGLKGAALAPTPQNLEAKKAAAIEYAAEVDKLSLVLHRLQKADVPTTTTEFQSKLKGKITAIRNFAKEKGVGLPPEFNLGFEKYTATLPKSDAVATQLSTLLDSVDGLVRLLISSGIARIDVFERSDLPAEKDADTSSRPAPPTPKAGAGKKGAKAGPVAPVAASITERYQVRVVVATDQAPLQILIGKLASPSETPDIPYFPVVRLLRIENEKQEGPLVQAAQAPAAPAPPAPPPPTSGTEDPKKKPAPKAAEAVQPAAPDAIMVLGGEQLKAYLEIDLVKFLDTQAPAATR